jgi:hypothetical protein
MSHVDEGALHAYLDGALDEYPAAEAIRIREHVETCAVCADALAAERKVREEAHAILGLAAPRVETPTFEELRAYVRASRPGRTVISVRLYRLGWAASVVLALGTGWLLRGGRAVPIAPLERAGDALPVPASEREESALQEQTLPQEPSATDAVELQSVEERDAPSGAAPPVEPMRVTVDRGTVEPQGAPPAPSPQGAQGLAEPLADARRLDDGAAAAGGLGTAVGAAAPAAPPTIGTAAPPPSAARVAERIDSAARVNQPERRVAQQDQVVTSAISADAAAPSQRQRAANEQAIQDEEPSLVIPGLEVLDVLPVGQGTTFAGMRALQRLETGDTLELVHLPAGIDPSFLPPLRPGDAQLVLQRGAGWLVMRAPVSERYLEELLQRLEGGR